MLRYLTKFEVRNPAIDADIANAVEQFPFLPLATPRTHEFSHAVVLFPFPDSPTLIIKDLFNQRAVSRKLFRSKIGEREITDQICGRRILREFGDICFNKRVGKLRSVIRFLLLPIPENSECINKIPLRSTHS